jgi:cytidine deaminase
VSARGADRARAAAAAPVAGGARVRASARRADGASDVDVDARARRKLLAAARAVRRHAHAPYSRFRVGAAVWDERGGVHVGCNVENASYGLTVCAERNALAAAVAAGARRIRAVAVVTDSRPPAPPCGACRQVLAELGADDTLVLLAGLTGPPLERRLGDLLPESFRL